MQASRFVQSLQKVKESHSAQAAKRSHQRTEFNLNGSQPARDRPEVAPTSFDSEAVEQDDMFPKIRLVSRYQSREDLLKMIPPETETLTITELYKQVSPPDFKRPPTASANFVVFGIVAARSVTRTSARGTNFVTITLSDLKYDISLALHGKAHEKFWKVRPGTLLALFNPQFYVQKFENTARSLALSLSKDTCLVEIGQAKDLGQCESMTSASKNSKRCKNWVDVRKSHVCEFHIEQKATKTKRPEFNASSAKLWDPKSGSSGSAGSSRLTVYEGGEVNWKRGLQVDTQAPGSRSHSGPGGFKGFPDAPVGRVFQRSVADRRADRSKYEESLDERKKRLARDKKQLELVTDDARLKSQLQQHQPVRGGRVTKDSTAKDSGRVFARTQLRKLGFNPLSISHQAKLPVTAARAPEDSDSDDLEII